MYNLKQMIFIKKGSQFDFMLNKKMYHFLAEIKNEYNNSYIYLAFDIEKNKIIQLKENELNKVLITF